MAIIINKNIRIPKLITLKKWCELTGDSEHAVYQRIQAGKWLLGIQYIKVENRIWVKHYEAQRWLLNPQIATLQALQA